MTQNVTSQPQPNQQNAGGASEPLAKQFRPIDHEARVWDRWVASGVFHADPARVAKGEARAYTILIPPPNVTDRLHLGHAFNNTIQDVLTRAHRMMGYEALWMPGTDHAGIATQAVVEKRLRASGELKGALKEAFTRDAFVEKIQAFKDEYEAVITGQLKRMGCSCDWERQRFTMDPQCAQAVREAFFRLFRDGLIYRGKRLVNWDPVLQTAVADDECFDEEIDGNFYYLRYPLVHPHGASTQHERESGTFPPGDAVPVTWSELRSRGWDVAEDAAHADDHQAWVTVATTRPETYLGDTAVAVSPHDPRAKALRGLCVELPLVGRVIPIVEDSYVVLPEALARTDEEKADPKAKFATGFLKVTPAHDANDHELYQRHKRVMDEFAGGGGAALINIFAPDATISDAHGWRDVGGAHLFVGLSRELARKKVVEVFKKHTVGSETGAVALFAKSIPYRHSVPHSDRSKAVVEPYLSDQWYVRVTDSKLARAANEALHTRELSFHPARYAKSYEQWHDNIRDWCISRQLWWGHRIPVWSAKHSAEHSLGFLKQVEELQKAGRVHSSIKAPELGQVISQAVSDVLHSACVRSESDSEAIALLEANGFARDPDVLDTWFSSALWPLSTLGWPHATPELAAFNPTSTLCTAREIITLWVSRMVMFNRYFMPKAGVRAQGSHVETQGLGHGPAPFKDVFIHAVIQDGQGQKMSKSLGNGVDPLDIIGSHGADAMRFTLCHMATQTQDVRMPVDLVCPHTGEVFAPKFVTNKDGYVVPASIQTSPKDPSKKMVTGYGVASGEVRPSPEMPLAKNTSSKFDMGRNFATKLWNAAKFAMMILENAEGKAVDGVAAGGTPAPQGRVGVEGLALVDRWMLSRLARGVNEANAALRDYQFSAYAQSVYDLLWRDFCDWYLEAIKPTVEKDAGQREVLRASIDTLVRLLHPVMPFVTEVLFEALARHARPEIAGLTLGAPRTAGLLASAGWPEASATLIDERAEREFEMMRALVSAIREVRAQHTVPFKRKVTLHTPSGAPDLLGGRELAMTLAGLEAITPSAPAGASVALSVDGLEYRLSNLKDAAEAVDTGAEKARLTKVVADLSKSVETLDKRLSNPGYADKAPPHMVQQSKEQLDKARRELAAAQAELAALA
jgi:valyl-tRNA synthetase